MIEKFVKSYFNFPDLASNIAQDAYEEGQPEVAQAIEKLGDVYIEDKEQLLSLIEGEV